MIDIDALNKFLDESNELIKKSRDFDGIAQTPQYKPLCSFRIDSDGGSMVFAIEARGFIRDEVVFFLVARHGMDDSSEFISRGHFTANEGHYTSFAMSHDKPRGMTVQQGVLIEMRNIVARMGDGNQSPFIEGIRTELNGVKVKISVVKSDECQLENIDEPCKANCTDDCTAFGKLNLKGDKPSVEEIKERLRKICNPEPVDDIFGNEFAKTMGNMDEKPEDGNGIDDALKETDVYQIEKQAPWQRIMLFLRKLFGFDKEKEELDGLCFEMFGNKEDK